MSATIRIPLSLRHLAGGAKVVDVDGRTLRDLIVALDSAHPGFAKRLLGTQQLLSPYVNVFVDDEDVRFLEGLDTHVPSGAVISIIPAVQGG